LSKIPCHVKFGVGVIDGHLQLMCLNPGLGSWDRFLQFLYINPIKRLFAAGCPTVVLCFDSYDSVPIYKSMTQAKRSRPHQGNICNFGPHDMLPGFIPEEPMVYLMNRNFKLKVIDFVCGRLPSLIALEKHQRFILDYKQVVEYTLQNKNVPTLVQDMVPIGESDVKFTRYVDLFGNALVHAIDGDYMMIALLYYAKRGLDHKIFIFRQLSTLNPKPTSDRAQGNKRKHTMDDDEDEDEEENHDHCTTSNETKTKKKKRVVQKCWVDMHLLYNAIAQSCLRTGGGAVIDIYTQQPYAAADMVHSVVFLMLCAGTDFSRPLPLLGPKRLWESMPSILGVLLHAARKDGLKPELFAAGVIGPLYSNLFARHVSEETFFPPGEAQCPPLVFLQRVLEQIRQAHTLAPRTRGRIPSQERIMVTLKNIAWVVRYWTVLNAPIEAPLDGSNGFVRNIKGEIVFEDAVAGPPDG